MKSPFSKAKSTKPEPEVAAPAAKPEVAAEEMARPAATDFREEAPAPAPAKPWVRVGCPVEPCVKPLNHAGEHTQGGVA